MDVLIVGAAGQLGTELRIRSQLRGYNTVAVDRSQLDISDETSVNELVTRLKPSVIINAAAYTVVDRAETDIATAYAVNRDGPLNLAKACASANIPLLHVSTDYVFDGDKLTPYNEMDTPNPQSVYGKSKYEGEIAVAITLQKQLTLRVSWVFSATGNNFVRTILRLAKERDELRIVADQTGAPTWAGDIAEVLLTVVDRLNQNNPIPWGLYHYSGSPSTNWHAFAEGICDQAITLGMLEKKPVIHPISAAEYPTAAKRPQNSMLDCAHILNELGMPQADWVNGLKKVLIAWKG